MSPCLTLSIIRYESRVSGAIQGKELRCPLYLGVVAIEKGAFGWPSTTVDQHIYIYIYIYISMIEIEHEYIRKYMKEQE